MISLPSLTSKRITTARIATTEPAFQVLQSTSGGRKLVAVVITGRFSFPDLHAAVDNESTERVAKGVSSNCPIKTGSGVMSVAEVRLQEGESVENALRRFKRKVQSENIIGEVKRHSYYLKPSVKLRAKQALARRRARKKFRKDSE